MKKIATPLFVALLCLLCPSGIWSQHTFSIVAVDPGTGEVGSAGATCLSSSDCGGCGGAIVISGLAPARGAINAQATVCLPNSNLNFGLNRLIQGYSAQDALSDLLASDPCNQGDTSNRQYGIVDFDSNMTPRVASFTGSSALSYANHRSGPNYSIQGNILIGPVVLDSLENAFNRVQGPLCEKLMAAMLAARIPGADSRCLSNGTSSKSAFIRIAKPTDALFNYWMDLNVPEVPAGMEPIDSLKTLFDEFKATSSLDPRQQVSVRIAPNPSDGVLRVHFEGTRVQPSLRVYAMDGKELLHVAVDPSQSELLLDVRDAADGRKLLFLLYQDAGTRRSFQVLLR